MTGPRARPPAARMAGLVLAVLGLVLLAGGCRAQLAQQVTIDGRGTGELKLTLKLDREAQNQLNLDRQLAEGTFLEFLRPDLEAWSAPDGSGKVFSDRTEGDGVRVFETRRTILSTPDDLRRVLDRARPIAPIVQATGLYQLPAGQPDEGGTRTRTAGTTGAGTTGAPGAATTTAGAPPPSREQILTGLPAATPLQGVLVLRFTAEDPEAAELATFRVGIRGGVGEIASATCSRTANPSPTTADDALAMSLAFDYRYRFPVEVESTSEGGRRAGRDASWSMPYGECDLIEASSAGADSSAPVNGLILGGALLFILIVLGLRILSRRRDRRSGPGL